MSTNSPKPATLQETERQAAELEAMRRMLAASQGTFSLSIAVCNSPALRDHLIDRLKATCDGIDVASIPGDSADVLDIVGASGWVKEPAALFVVGLDRSLPSSEKDHPILSALSASRELWPQTFRCPVVFWLPEYAVTLLATEGRDFWAWRSHQFDFVSELASPAQAIVHDRASTEVSQDLDADRKQFRIAELEQRINEAGDPPLPGLGWHIAIWLTELGHLLATVGQVDQAEQMYRRALEMDEELDREDGVASDYSYLGLIYNKRGDLDEAERMHRKALEISERLGHQEGMAADYGNLGVIYCTRGDLDEAERMLRKALEIHERLGNKEGMAIDYGNLGSISRMRGDLQGAEQTLREALEISERLGRQERMANEYGNLGLIYRARGDLDEAERMHRKALEIDEQLGHQQGMAITYGDLGVIYRMRGDLDEAERMHRKALAINEYLGHQQGMAADYGNLGLIHEMRKEVDQAREFAAKARDLFAKIGIPDEASKAQAQLDALGGEGDQS